MRSRCRAYRPCPVARSRGAVPLRSGEIEHKGGEPPRAITTALLVIFMVFNVFPRNPKNFVLLSIPSLRSLCSFVLKHRARRHAHGALRTQYSHAWDARPRGDAAHYAGGAMLGRRASRLAPYRHYTRNIRTCGAHENGVRALPARNVAANCPKAVGVSPLKKKKRTPFGMRLEMVGDSGLGPPTFCMSSKRSNQLS